MKTTIIALCAAALIAAAPAALAQGVPGKTPALQHKVAKKHRPRVSGYLPLREARTKTGYPKAFRYAPAEPMDSVIESSRQAGGGGGGGM